MIFLNSSPYITLWQWQSIPRVWLLNCLQSIAKMISIKTTIYYMFYLPANLLSSLLSWARSGFPSANYILLTPSHSVFVATCLWLLSIFSLLWLSQSLLTEKSPFLQILMCWYPKIFSFYFLRLLTNVVEFKSFKVSFPHRPQATSSLGHTGCYLLFVSVSLSIYSSITCHPNTVSSHWILLSEKVTLYIYL